MGILCSCEIGLGETRHDRQFMFSDIQIQRNDDDIVILIGLDHLILRINHNREVITS
ncbi:hypothetical protein SDC9_201349 [bioreactor metagenome]|uniref:Uncharacterized protein n=1 Tax=bioreactor metagenome TaxID=1076179 RepID=A0A645IZM0_9ZZZZ